jgi:hypothetical protein
LVGHVLDHLDDAFDILRSGFQVVDQGFRTMDIGRDIADASAASLMTLTPLLASLPDSTVMLLASDARSATWFTLTVICSTVAATLAEALLCWRHWPPVRVATGLRTRWQWTRRPVDFIEAVLQAAQQFVDGVGHHAQLVIAGNANARGEIQLAGDVLDKVPSRARRLRRLLMVTMPKIRLNRMATALMAIWVISSF